MRERGDDTQVTATNLGRCSEDAFSVHGAYALPTELL